MKSCPRRGTHTHTHTDGLCNIMASGPVCRERAPLSALSPQLHLSLHSYSPKPPFWSPEPTHLSATYFFHPPHSPPRLRLNGENSSHTATTIEGDNGCLATVEMWAGMLFDSEPATSPLPCNETPEICLSKAGTIGARRAWEEMLISSQDSLHVCYPICVFIICVLRSGRDVTSDI